MVNIALTSTSTGFVETDFDQIKDVLEDGGVDANLLGIVQTGTSGNALSVVRDLASASSDSAVVQITQDNTGDDQIAVSIKQDGAAGDGILLNHTNTSSTSAAIDITRDTGAELVLLVNDRTSSSGTNHFFRNLASGNTAGPVVFIEQDNSGDNQAGLIIQQDGDADALKVNHNDTTTVDSGIDVQRDSGKEKSFLVHARSSSLGSNYFYRNLASGSTAGPVMFIEQDNSSDDQPALRIQQDVTTVEAIDFSVGSIAFNFASAMASTGANTPSLTNSPSAGSVTWVAVEVNGVSGTMPVVFDV